MLHHDFRRFLDALDRLNPAQIEDAQSKIRDLRRKTEAISEIEARAIQDHKCPFCGDLRVQAMAQPSRHLNKNLHSIALQLNVLRLPLLSLTKE